MTPECRFITIELPLDPLPVVGRDFGLIVKVAV